MLEKLPNYPNIHKAHGDATSDYVLRKSNIDKADYLIAFTDSEEINYEIAVLGKKHSVPKIISYVPTYKNLERFKKLGVTIIGGPQDIALFVYNKITYARKAIGVGLGKGEIVEITIEEYSPLANKTLAQIALHDIRIAAIYRDNNLIVPTSNSLIKPGDRILLVGHPEKLTYATRILTSAKIEFPMQYGNAILSIVYKSANVLNEISYIKKSTPVQYIKLITTLENLPENSSLDEIDYVKSKNDMVKKLKKETYGLLIAEKEPINILSKIGLAKSIFQEIVNNIPNQTPILFASSKDSYKSALVYIFENDKELIRKTLHTAISIENTMKIKLDIIVCEHPDTQDLLNTTEKIANRIFSIYRKKINISIVSGNPVREFENLKNNYDLAIIAGYKTKNTLFKPNPAYFISNSNNISVLVTLK